MDKEKTSMTGGQLSLEDEKELDRLLSQGLNEDLSQLTVREELIQKTLKRIEADSRKEGIAGERSVRKPQRSGSRRKAWFGLAAAASVALLAMAVRVSGTGRYDGNCSNDMMAPEFSGGQGNDLYSKYGQYSDKSQITDEMQSYGEKNWPVDAMESEMPDSVQNELPGSCGQEIAKDDIMDGTAECTEDNIMSAEPDGDMKYTDASKQWGTEPAFTLEEFALLGERMEDDFVIPQATDGDWCVRFAGKSGEVTCLVGEDDRILIYLQTADEIWYGTMQDEEYAEWLRVQAAYDE